MKATMISNYKLIKAKSLEAIQAAWQKSLQVTGKIAFFDLLTEKWQWTDWDPFFTFDCLLCEPCSVNEGGSKKVVLTYRNTCVNRLYYQRAKTTTAITDFNPPFQNSHI